MDLSTGGGLRRRFQRALAAWAARSPWRPFYLSLAMTGAAVALILSPDTFVSPSRSTDAIPLSGWIAAVLFGGVSLVQGVRAPRSRN